jgi:hypothetical protein
MKKDSHIHENEPEGMRPNQKGRTSGKTEHSSTARGSMASASRGRETASKAAGPKAMRGSKGAGDETDQGPSSRQISDAGNSSGQV